MVSIMKQAKRFKTLILLSILPHLAGCIQLQQTISEAVKLPEFISSPPKATSSPGTPPQSSGSSSNPALTAPTQSSPAPAVAAPQSSSQQAYWLSIEPGPRGALNNIHFIDFNTGWAVGDKGLI